MKCCGRMLVCGLVAVALNAGAIVSISNVKDGPYRTITRRNIFGLLPVYSRTGTPTPVISRPKITLAGITTLVGGKLAILMLPAKAGGVRECLLLREGETQEEIRVREIGIESVRVVNHGEEQTLTFDENPAEPINPALDPPVESMRMPVPEKPLTVEQQVLVIEAQRMKATQDGDPIAKILPPTEFSAETTGGTP